MQLFLKLFGPYLQWLYHGFDRIVINGHLIGLLRENQVVYFFPQVCGHPKLTQDLLRQRTRDYQQWVRHFAHNHRLPWEWPAKGTRKEDLVRSRQQRRLQARHYGVYYILQSLEQGWTSRVFSPKYAAKDPNYQILKKQRSRYTHYYFYVVEQVEYCRNFIFKRSWPIRSIFRRSCELGLYLLTADRVTVLFGGRQMRRLHGKLQNVMERMDHGLHVFRTYWRNSFLKQYEKAATFLRLELVCNRVQDFKLKKSLKHWEARRQKFQEVTDRFAGVQAQHLNVHGQLDGVARLAKPVIQGHTKVSGIKLEQTRILRLLEVLLQGASGHLRQWTTARLRQTLLEDYGLKAKDYTLNQIRYDLRKLRLHGLIERLPHSHAYRFTAKGQKLSILLVQLRKRLYGPIAFGVLRHRPHPDHQPDSEFERAYHKVDHAIDEVLALMAA